MLCNRATFFSDWGGGEQGEKGYMRKREGRRERKREMRERKRERESSNDLLHFAV